MPGWLNGLAALEFRGLTHLGARPGVRDLARTERSRAFLGRFEVSIGRRVGLHEQDLAALTRCVGDLDVEGYLKPPSGRFFGLFACRPRAFARRFQFFCGLGERQVPRFAVLVDLLEAAVRGGAFRQREFFVVGFEIRFSVRIVVGVDQRHGLRGGCAGRQLVGGMQILWSQAKGARARRRRGQWRTAREPERVFASTSFRGSRHELQCQAPGAPKSSLRADRVDGVVRARQRRDSGDSHARNTEQSKHGRDHDRTKHSRLPPARAHRSLLSLIRAGLASNGKQRRTHLLHDPRLGHTKLASSVPHRHQRGATRTTFDPYDPHPVGTSDPPLELVLDPAGCGVALLSVCLQVTLNVSEMLTPVSVPFTLIDPEPTAADPGIVTSVENSPPLLVFTPGKTVWTLA